MNRAIKFIATFLSTSLIAVSLLAPSLASAFSGYGLGTQVNPFRISTCSQLQEINNNLSAYYDLVSNIDCTGNSFTSIGEDGPFTGTLNGQDHTIKNLNTDSYGLFDSAISATIENINISGGSITGASATVDLGSFVAESSNSTLTNLHSNMTLQLDSFGYVGGLVGFLDIGTTISQSSFTGSISGNNTDSYMGGLVGFMWDTGNIISDSFSTGTITPPAASSQIGGIIGASSGSAGSNGELLRDYSNMTIQTTGQTDVGGLEGSFVLGSVLDSFSASTFVGSGTNIGGAFGYGNSSPSTNNYFDAFIAGTTSCSGNGSTTCTAENISNADPTYFKDTNNSGPFSTWDFNTIWSVTSGYPTLKNLTGFNGLIGVPNNGEAAGDGTLDSYQGNIADIEDSNGIWTTVVIPSNTLCTFGNTQSFLPSSVAIDPGYSAQVSLADFDIYCPTPGTTVPVTIIYDKVYNVSSSALRFFDSTTSTYSTVSGAVFGTTTIGGIQKTTVTYSIADGGPFDSDGLSNGVIVDPVGIASTVVSSPDTGFAKSNSSNIITAYVTLPIAVLILVSSVILKRKNKF